MIGTGGQKQQAGHDEKQKQQPGEGFQIEGAHRLNLPGPIASAVTPERADIFRQLAIEDQRRQAASEGFAHHDPVASLAREPPEAGRGGIFAGDGRIVRGEGAQARPAPLDAPDLDGGAPLDPIHQQSDIHFLGLDVLGLDRRLIAGGGEQLAGLGVHIGLVPGHAEHGPVPDVIAIGRRQDDRGASLGLQSQRRQAGEGGEAIGPGAGRVDDKGCCDAVAPRFDPPEPVAPLDPRDWRIADQLAGAAREALEIATVDGMDVHIHHPGLIGGPAHALAAEDGEEGGCLIQGDLAHLVAPKTVERQEFSPAPGGSRHRRS